MAMSRFEKFFVNRQGKGRRNARKVSERLQDLDTGAIHDVLEIGCGIGTVSAFIADAYDKHVIGTDFDPAQVERAKELHTGRQYLHFQVEDAAALSFADHSFDLVVAHNVFHHIPDWDVAMTEVRRVLRPMGYLMWLDLVFARPIRSLLTAVDGKESFFSLDEVKAAFKESGLDERFHERMPLLAFAQHHFVLQRT